MTSPSASADLRQGEPLQCRPDAGFLDWIAGAQGSVVVSTYQAGKLLLLGWDGGQVHVLMRQYDKPMGFDVTREHLVLATRDHIIVHANDPALAQNYRAPGRYDALYLPRLSWHTGDLNVHDVAFTGDEVCFVNTRFSCLARPSAATSFEPRWSPAFVSALAPEDRCHLNGLAVARARPHYVTCLGETDTAGGWREGKAGGGLLIDVQNNEVLVRGLIMPHSPRCHGGALYVLNSGAGELLQVDPGDGTTQVVCRLQGYLRGLAFAGDHALVGLCRIRERGVFDAMPVCERYDRLLCGIAVVALDSGRLVGTFEFTAGCEEIFEVGFVAGVRRANVFSPGKPEAAQAFNAPGVSWWLRPPPGDGNGR